MLFTPGAILIAALPYYARISIVILLGILGISCLFTSSLSAYSTTIIPTVIAILVYFSISSWELTKQRIRELTSHLEDFKNDDVVNLSYNDPVFNKLANHVNYLLRILSRKEHLLQSCSQEARYTATELQTSSNAVALGAEEEHIALDAIVVTSEEMNQTIGDILGRVNSTADMAQMTLTESNSGYSALEELKNQVNTMQSTVRHNQEQMMQLIQTAEDITNFVETIEQITSQINLLALNASIEAARAGEAGRGFAVVANEVRLLAESTENATHDISKLVGSIASQVNISKETSVELMGFTSKVVNGSDTAIQSLDSIKTAAQSTQKEIQQSTDSITEFGLANEEMSKRLLNIAKVSEQHSQVSKDTKDMVKYLEWLSSRLEQKEMEV
ncbi:methyl-accepting chemotaxis protein [Marinomonas sp. C2222]|uniref:Methyl-accepting chemotaxis protein n=1 Tax=Marinomonas sargassi TaxID=2984494 RepID=A0ABT2YR61_9GAMM|nr:methyl-accepting chemotaxis protein [Marinomonas sargassi]MCV2402375.1 methyl-accepting chemotaxis protein [Marinomonas sargassi]